MSIQLCCEKFQEYSEEINDIKDLDVNEMLRYIMMRGSSLQGLTEEECIDANYVKGCVSNAFIVVEEDEEAHARIRANVDAMIVRGFVSILSECCAVLTIKELVEEGYAIISGFLATLDLDIVLSPNRANAFGNVILLILKKAEIIHKKTK